MRVELPVGLAAAERMQNQCFTRPTTAFSKKWENHELTFALFVAWYNFCRPHMTFKATPAVAAGLTSEAWTLERLLAVARINTRRRRYHESQAFLRGHDYRDTRRGEGLLLRG